MALPTQAGNHWPCWAIWVGGRRVPELLRASQPWPQATGRDLGEMAALAPCSPSAATPGCPPRSAQAPAAVSWGCSRRHHPPLSETPWAATSSLTSWVQTWAHRGPKSGSLPAPWSSSRVPQHACLSGMQLSGIRVQGQLPSPGPEDSLYHRDQVLGPPPSSTCFVTSGSSSWNKKCFSLAKTPQVPALLRSWAGATHEWSKQSVVHDADSFCL